MRLVLALVLSVSHSFCAVSQIQEEFKFKLPIAILQKHLVLVALWMAVQSLKAQTCRPMPSCKGNL